MAKRILITGGAGFIGSHIVDELVNKDYEITVLDSLIRGKIESIQPHIDSKRITFIKGDVLDKKIVDETVSKADYVFHEAADNINKSQKFPTDSVDVNMVGSVNVFDACLRHGIKRIIYASSASVYGNPKKLPMCESDELNPITPYCITKRACEDLLKFYSTKGLKYNILRYFNVYGERQNTDAYYTSVIILFIKRLMNNEAPRIDGDGSQSMDFVNIKDIAQANILALESEVENEIFNVASGVQTSIKELAEILIDSLGLNIQPEFNPRPVLVTRRQADISKIQKMLGYKVLVNRDEGLRAVALDVKNNIDKY